MISERIKESRLHDAEHKDLATPYEECSITPAIAVKRRHLLGGEARQVLCRGPDGLPPAPFTLSRGAHFVLHFLQWRMQS